MHASDKGSMVRVAGDVPPAELTGLTACLFCIFGRFQHLAHLSSPVMDPPPCHYILQKRAKLCTADSICSPLFPCQVIS